MEIFEILLDSVKQEYEFRKGYYKFIKELIQPEQRVQIESKIKELENMINDLEKQIEGLS